MWSFPYDKPDVRSLRYYLPAPLVHEVGKCLLGQARVLALALNVPPLPVPRRQGQLIHRVADNAVVYINGQLQQVLLVE